MLEEGYKERVLDLGELKAFLEKDEQISNKNHLINALIRHQLKYWQLLVDAYEELKQIKTRSIPINGRFRNRFQSFENT